MSKAQDVQYIVLWSIAGPFAFVLTLFVVGTMLNSVSGPNTDSWLVGFGAVLHYCSRFAVVLATPVVAAFGLLGLVKLRKTQVKHKALTLGVCALALALPVLIGAALYIGN